MESFGFLLALHCDSMSYLWKNREDEFGEMIEMKYLRFGMSDVYMKLVSKEVFTYVRVVQYGMLLGYRWAFLQILLVNWPVQV